MEAAIGVRWDFSADQVREAAKASSDVGQCRHLLAIAAVLDGGSRSEAAKIGGVGLQALRDWVLRFNAEGPAGLIHRKAPGKMPKLNAGQQAALAELVEAGPIPAVHGVVRWRCKDLVQWVWEEFGITMDESTMDRLLARLGFRHISARPRHHAQGDAVNPILAAAGYNFSLILKWLRTLMCLIAFSCRMLMRPATA